MREGSNYCNQRNFLKICHLQVLPEKHIEAALQALKQGDNTGSITHAEEAKKMLNGS